MASRCFGWLGFQWRGVRSCGTGALMATLMAGVPVAQWAQLAPSQTPGPRAGAVMAYDELRNETILYGGDPNDTSTWAWDGVNWRVAGSGPPARNDAAMTWFGANNTLVMFGGGPFATLPCETWQWNGSWTLLPGAYCPGGRVKHAMAYDPVRARAVLFGGDSYLGPLNDTSEWDGVTWRPMFVAGPGARSGHAMAWDPIRRTIVLFGGTPNSSMWEWSGVAWSPIQATGPSPRHGHRMVTIPGGILLFGGSGGLNDTWIWNGSAWLQVTGQSPPPGRERCGLARARNGILLYGGAGISGLLGDTWVSSMGPITLPGAAQTMEGNAALPFGDAPRRRMQTVIAAAAFPPLQRVGTLHNLRVRRDAGPTPFLARNVDLRIVLGVCRTSPQTMSTDFLANWSGTPTLVYQGTVAFPVAPPVQPGPAAFNAPLSFQQSFFWSGQDLALEFEVAGTTLLAPWDIDAQTQAFATGSVTSFGTSCAGSRGVPSLTPPDARRVVVGGSIDIGLTGALPGALALGFLGDNDSQWLGLTLPFQWPGTNCFVYHNWVLTPSTPVQGDGSARLVLPIPQSPGLAGQRLFAQGGVYEGALAFPPLVLTSAARMTIGANLPVHWDTIVNTDGSFVGSKVPGRYLTPVIQFDL